MGTVYDSSNVPRYVISGHWDGDFSLAKVKSVQAKVPVTEDPEVLWTASSPE